MEQPQSRAAYLLALTSMKGVGPWTAVRVLRAYPEPDAFFAAGPPEREKALGAGFAGRLTPLSLAAWPAMLEHGERIVSDHAAKDIRLVVIDDDPYPPLMALAPSPAALLYVRGRVPALRNDDTVAVIGTRTPTAAGIEIARRLARHLAEAGFTVVSGLAAGIDRAGHEGALEAKGTTVAVLGTAIDKVYPAANKKLAEKIVESGGALISEYPAGSVTTKGHFVERDRLQAAMSIAVIAVQTGVRGGTLHTVRFATEAHRAVIVPRPVGAEHENAMYGGIHALLDDGRAAVIETSSDYPRLFHFLKVYRDWIVHGGVRPDLAPPGGSTAEMGLGHQSREEEQDDSAATTRPALEPESQTTLDL